LALLALGMLAIFITKSCYMTGYVQSSGSLPGGPVYQCTYSPTPIAVLLLAPGILVTLLGIRASRRGEQVEQQADLADLQHHLTEASAADRPRQAVISARVSETQREAHDITLPEI
jgi:hypothetical protein